MKIFQYDETINVDEDQEHEFKGVQVTKQPVEQISDYAEKYINAFLNTNGGTIYFGVEDDGKVRGIILNRRGRDLLRLKLDNIVSSFKPQVDPNLVRVTFIPVDMTDVSNTPFTSSTLSYSLHSVLCIQQ
jgi:predicted HTH transcriptional regulator